MISSALLPPASLVAVVREKTEGNPFFVSAIVRLRAAERHPQAGEEVTAWSVPLPQGVRETIRPR